MPITYQIDSERDLVLVEGHGTLAFDDHLKFRAELINDPHFTTGMKELADYRSVEKLDFSMEGLDKFIEQEKQYIDLLRDYQIAIVTTDDLHFGFARIYMAKMSDLISNVKVFRDIEVAKAWLLGKVEPSASDEE
jgi:hypothetical protein